MSDANVNEDPIQAALRKAQEARALVPAAPPAVPAIASGPAVVPQRLTMESSLANAMSVDKWFKVTEDGLKIGDSKLIPGGVKATIDMTDGSGFIRKQAIKGGNPAQYAYTTDLATATNGGSWDSAVAKIRALAPGANPYPAVDLPFTLVEEVKDMGGTVVGKPGDTVGYTTSTTNWANWVRFYKTVKEAALLGSTVLVRLTQQARTNPNKNTWGVIQFELLGSAEQE